MIFLAGMLRRLVIVLSFMFVVLPAAFVQAAPDILPVDQITPGMRGIAKTVVIGTKIENFNVEVINVMKGRNSTGDLILVRASGDVMDRTGGIVQGMSGSPVYINGKLVGAIAYGWPMTDHRLAMVTPIADMLKLWNIENAPGTVASGAQSSSADWSLSEEATPLMVSGFGAPALQMLKERLPSYQVVPYAVGDAPANLAFGSLEPGSSVGAQLVRGDVTMEALGTVTYVEGNKVLAFGHPFLQRGHANYFMTNAYVFATVNALSDGHKEGTSGQILGTVNQDRGAGIAGEIGSYPAVIPLACTVRDVDLNKKQEGAVQIIQDEQLAPVLAATSVYNYVSKVMDRVGEGTARIRFEISSPDVPGGTLVRENMFYHPSNVGQAAVGEFLTTMAILSNNPYKAVNISDVKVDVAVGTERRIADILEAHPRQTTVKPGQAVEVAVKLQPYRGQAITRDVTFVVPEKQAPGGMTLEVRGGSAVPVSPAAEEQPKQNKPKGKNPHVTFETLINGWKNRDRNNDIVVEPATNGAPGADADDEFKDSGSGKTDQEDPDQDSDVTKPLQHKATVDHVAAPAAESGNPKAHLTTDYVIEGDTQIVIQVAR